MHANILYPPSKKIHREIQGSQTSENWRLGKATLKKKNITFIMFNFKFFMGSTKYHFCKGTFNWMNHIKRLCGNWLRTSKSAGRKFQRAPLLLLLVNSERIRCPWLLSEKGQLFLTNLTQNGIHLIGKVLQKAVIELHWINTSFW